MAQPKLFMLLLGCKPKGRNTEQHDTMFAIGNSLKELIPQVLNSWPGAGPIHIDGWREVKQVDGYAIHVVPRKENDKASPNKLFFLNLGGYKQGEFEEFHYKMITVAPDKAGAIKQSRQTAFYKHTGFKGAESHIDDKYGVDVDDIYEIEDILSPEIKEMHTIGIATVKNSSLAEDEVQLGYFKLSAL